MNATDSVSNGYRCVSGGTVENGSMVVNWKTTKGATGSAVILDPTDSQWWWRPTVGITDDAPVTEYKVGSGEWTGVGMTAYPPPPPPAAPDTNDHRASINYSHTPTNPTPAQTVTPQDNASVDGHYFGHGAVPVHSVGALARARVTLHVTTAGTADNAKVTNWKIFVTGELYSRMEH